MDGMDVSLCTIDLNTNILTFAGAMRPLYLVRNGELTILKGTKTSVGGRQLDLETHFNSVSTPLQKGDMIFMTSDGYPDQFGGDNNKKLLLGRFKKLLVEIAHKPCKEQKKEINNRLESWMGDTFQVDEIIVIGVRI